MQDAIIAVGILVVFYLVIVRLLRPRPLTQQEKDFVSFVQDQARIAKLPKEKMGEFVTNQFDLLTAVFSVNGPSMFNDVPRLMKEIVDTYRPAA